MVQPMGKMGWLFLKILNTELSLDLGIPLLGLSSTELKVGSWREMCTPKFTTASFTAAKGRSNPRGCFPFPVSTVPQGHQIIDERKFIFMGVFQLINRRNDQIRVPPSCNPWQMAGSGQCSSMTGNSTWQDNQVSYVYLLVKVPSLQSCLQIDLPPKTQTTEAESDLSLSTQPPTYRK